MIKVKADIKKALQDIKSYNKLTQEKFKRQVLKSGFNIDRGAKKIIQSNGSVDSGNLINSVHILRMRSDGFGLEVGTNVKYAPHVEYGTKPHKIEAKNKKVLSNKNGSVKSRKATGGPVIFGKVVNHPGTKPKPFLFPAWEGERPHFIKNITKILNEGR